MSVPAGFIETVYPTALDLRGRPLTQSTPSAVAPCFIRGVLLTLEESFRFTRFADALEDFPRWAMYGGPMAFADYPSAERILSDWANGLTWRAVSEPAFLIPDGFEGRRWPRTSYRWQWIHETTPPEQWRIVAPREQWPEALIQGGWQWRRVR